MCVHKGELNTRIARSEIEQRLIISAKVKKVHVPLGKKSLRSFRNTAFTEVNLVQNDPHLSFSTSTFTTLTSLPFVPPFSFRPRHTFNPIIIIISIFLPLKQARESSQHVTVPIRRRQNIYMAVRRSQQEIVIDAAEIDTSTATYIVHVVAVVVMVIVVV